MRPAVTIDRESADRSAPAVRNASPARFLLAAAFVAPTTARLQRLRELADGVDEWEHVVATAERHGMVALVARNVREADARVPASVRVTLEERAAVMREDATRFRFTLERFVRAAAERGIVPTLLKGASLVPDVYADPSWRGQGDLDLLVEPHEVRGAIVAGHAAGLLPGERSFPAWWYLRSHFHLKLLPSSGLLREVEVHWALQHPSLLLTPHLAEVKARRVAREIGGQRVFELDPLDRLLHLTTHLVSHARGIPGAADARTLERVVEDDGHPLRLKWFVDLFAEFERLGGSLPVQELSRRAFEWGAEEQLLWFVDWLRASVELADDADASTSALAAALREAGASLPAAEGVRAQSAGPLDGFDFRADALARFPRWLCPPAEFLARAYGNRPLRRARHGARVLAHLLANGALLPIAIVGGRLCANARRRAFAARQDPQAVLDLAVAWRRFTSRTP